MILTEEGYKTVQENQEPEYQDQMEVVFENGRLLRDEKFEDIRERVALFSHKEVCLK